jgi:hypothetical protein
VSDEDDPWAPTWSPYAEDWDDPAPPREITEAEMAALRERVQEMARRAVEYMNKVAAESLNGARTRPPED